MYPCDDGLYPEGIRGSSCLLKVFVVPNVKFMGTVYLQLLPVLTNDRLSVATILFLFFFFQIEQDFAVLYGREADDGLITKWVCTNIVYLLCSSCHAFCRQDWDKKQERKDGPCNVNGIACLFHRYTQPVGVFLCWDYLGNFHQMCGT